MMPRLMRDQNLLVLLIFLLQVLVHSLDELSLRLLPLLSDILAAISVSIATR
jgi:hypothetical protein